MSLLGLGLGLAVSPWFFAIVGFVGLNLIQSSFTDTCPAEDLLPGCDSTDEPAEGATMLETQ